MRWKLLAATAMAAMLLGAGCAAPPKLGLPTPTSPPYSGFTEWGLVGASTTETWAFAYGCTAAETNVWASVDPELQEPGTGVSDMLVTVLHGYVPGVASVWGAPSWGGVEFLREGGESDVAVVPGGECFTVAVASFNFGSDTPAGIVGFTLNW